MPSRLPTQSSTLYANNISKLLLSAGQKNHYHLDLEDEVIRGSIILKEGEMMWPPPKPIGPPTPAPVKETKPAVVKQEASPFQAALTDTSLTAGIDP